MKKYVKTIIIVSVLALMCIAYFFYLSNRKSTKDATDKSVGNQEVAALTTKDIDKKIKELEDNEIDTVDKLTDYIDKKIEDFESENKEPTTVEELTSQIDKKIQKLEEGK